MDEDLDFLDGQEPAETAAPVAEQPEAPPEAVLDGPQRGPDGKFVAKAPEEPQAPATPPEAAPAAQAPAEPVAPPPGYVPVSALQEIRKEMQALRQAQQAPPAPAPDPLEDPEGYDAHQEGQRIALNAQWSHKLALATHGEEAVTKAQEWAATRFEQDPVFRQRSLAHPDPFGFAIAEHQREQALELFTDSKLLNDFRAWQAGQARPAQPATAPPAPPTPVAAPTSIIGQPSAGGIGQVPLGDSALFDSVIPK